MNEQMIERNEDAIDKLERDDSLDFWHRQRLILYHQRRIFRWIKRSGEEFP
ncbi:MAG: hypothetical protein KKE05_06245 [Nanoarchaeota archaeon]|nr:hypothetical protein [Nanoarchaeota archaeon]